MLKSKTKIIFLAIIFFGIFGLANSSQAADIMVSPLGVGAKTGIDWNNTADWSTLTFARGNTYYISGGVYGGRSITTAVSDTDRINIVKATTGVHGTDVGWVSSLANQAVFSVQGNDFNLGRSYITFDGITGDGSVGGVGGPGADENNYGFKIVPANCSNTALQHGLMQAPFSATVNLDNIIIRHIAFVQCAPENQITNQGYVGLKSTMYNSTYLKTNFIVDYNLFKNGSTNLHSTVSGTGSEVGYNYFSNNTCPTSCQQISNGGGEANVSYHHNIFLDSIWAVMGVHGTNNRNGLVYNNIVSCTENANTGAIALDSVSPRRTLDVILNWKIYNNTTANCQGGSIGDGWFAPGNLSDVNAYKSLAYNNIFWGVKNCNFTNQNGVSDAVEQNSNYYSGCTNITAGDTNPQITTSDPFVNSAAYNYALSGHTSAGVNLSNYFTADFVDAARSYWDRGAFEYISGGDTISPAPPSGLVVN